MLSEECFDEEYVENDDIYSLLMELEYVPETLEYIDEYKKILNEYCGKCMRYEYHPCRQLSRIIGETALLLEKLPNEGREYLKQKKSIRDYKEDLRTGQITVTDYDFAYDQLDNKELENEERIDKIALNLKVAMTAFDSIKFTIENFTLLTGCPQAIHHSIKANRNAS